MSSLLVSGRETLSRCCRLLETLPDTVYSHRVPEAYNATIGSHIRHCLNHFEGLLDGLADGLVDYDDRTRDPRIETDRRFAREQIQRRLEALDRLDADALDRPLRVRASVHAQLEPAESPSTVGRELMFCVIHAVHHFALIGMMAAHLHQPLPEDFGLAPSTVKHLRSTVDG